jgi:hypothetical protein
MVAQSADHRALSRLLFSAPALVLLLYGAAPLSTSGLREDEVQCEEAKAHLLDCCAPFTGLLDCEFIDHGCGATYPNLDVEQSRELQRRSCDDLRANGSCEKNFAEGP